jgi:DNA relaxase NicK
VAQWVAGSLVEQEVRDGHKLQLGGWHGYQTEGAGGARWGTRPDSLLAELRGGLAAVSWRSLAEIAEGRPTRLDLAVTVELPDDSRDWAGRAWKAASKRYGRAGRPVAKTIVVSDPGGRTCYLGAPTSDQRGRVYDKGKQAPEVYPPGSWRYEVQLRDLFARQAAEQLLRAGDELGSIVTTVHNWFARRGVNPPFEPAGEGIEMEGRRSRTDVRQKLQWLEEQVAPTVAWLVAEGHRDAVLRALGLTGELGAAERPAGPSEPVTDGGSEGTHLLP